MVSGLSYNATLCQKRKEDILKTVDFCFLSFECSFGVSFLEIVCDILKLIDYTSNKEQSKSILRLLLHAKNGCENFCANIMKGNIYLHASFILLVLEKSELPVNNCPKNGKEEKKETGAPVLQ